MADMAAAVIVTADKKTRIAVAMIRATAADVTPEAMGANQRRRSQTEARQRKMRAAAVAGGAGALDLGLAAEIVDVTGQRTGIEAKTEETRIGTGIGIVGDDTGIETEIAIVVETGTGTEAVMTNSRLEIALPMLKKPTSSSSVSCWNDRSPAKCYTEFLVAYSVDV